MASIQDYFMTLDPETGATHPERLLAAYKETKALTQQTKFKSASSLEWEGTDANMGGRTRAIMWDPNDVSGNKVWAGGVTGGLWYRDDITDKVIGLERGADDYMPKPYDPRELVTRIKTILRRTHSVDEKPKAKEELFVADAHAHSITFKGELLELTAAEYDILLMLIQHKNGSVSREQLLYESEHIDDDSSIKNIDVIISRIRQKIAKIDSDNVYIKPIRGVGYLLTDNHI
jgi:two-component system OmpR family response regulator